MGNEIGLEALWRDAGFLGGISEYLAKVKEGESTTTTASGKISQGLSAIGGTIVTAALAAAALAISTVVAATVAAVPAFLDWAETLDGVGDVLGTTSEESAALAVAIRGVGGDVGQMTAQMAFLTRGLETADGKLGPTGEAMKKLGISFKDANGNILPATDILTNVADVVGNMPDGLEKTKIMMSLFGKSGKDLSDVMSALAGGGLAEADEMAKQLGLSLGDEATDGAIQLGRSFNKLKMVGQGLMVAFGQKLAPAISTLTASVMDFLMKNLPAIKQFIDSVSSWVGNAIYFIGDFVGTLTSLGLKEALEVAFGDAGTIIYNVVSGIQNFINYIVSNKPILIGALAAIAAAIAYWAYVTISQAIPTITLFVTSMGPAIAVMLAIGAVVAALAWAWENNFMGMRDTLTEFWNTSVLPTLQQLWTWLQINIPIALQALSNFWTTVLLPAILSVWAWVQGTLFPLLAQLWAWLQINIPLALQALSNFWTTVLLPAILSVWAWVQGTLFPLLAELWNWLQVNVPIALQTLADFWTNVLLPAILGVWTWINGTLFPLLAQLWNWIQTTIPVALQVLANFWTTVLLPAITGVWAFITNVLFPLFRSLVNFIAAVFNVVLTLLAIIFNTVVLPAIRAVWSFIEGSLLPIFNRVWTFIRDNLIPIIEKVSEIFLTTFVNAIRIAAEQIRLKFEGAINWIADKLQWLADWLNEIAEKFKNLFGSYGEQTNFTALVNTAALLPTTATAVNGSTTATNRPTPSSMTSVNNMAVNFGGVNINNGMDFAMFDARVRNVVRSELNGGLT